MRQKIFLILITIFFLNFVYPKDFRDPFSPLLPQDAEEEEMIGRIEGEGRKETEEIYYPPPEVNVEGVLWGTDNPLTIIDGEVYKVGDKIKNTEVKVFKIEKNSVYIGYKGRLHRLTTKKKEERR
ncbi:MAG TPA: hypothetical protein EYP89_04650 [Candidatus Omnitrophica bacterium]|nr:hypothetical protein [Candidatus Omnitrophota bacterium]